MTSTVVSLANMLSWDPAELTAALNRWPGDPDTAPLGELVATLAPDAWVDRGAPVITSASLDSSDGGVVRRRTDYEGGGFQVSRAGTSLVPGDLLVPLNPALPVLMVSGAHVGALVAGHFLALKPTAGWGLWLWATLSSTSGQKFRAAHVADITSPTIAKGRLLNLRIPVLPSNVGQLAEALQKIEVSTQRPEAEAVETWWRTDNLLGADWSEQLATRSPEAIERGTPLVELCSRIELGKHIPQELRLAHPQARARPIVDGGVLAGRPIRHWALTGPLVEPGDLLLAAMGSRPHAQVATQPMIAASSVFVLRPKDPALAAPLVAYLNGQDGFSRRQLLLTGTAIERLERRRLEQLGVIPEALHDRSSDNSGMPLSVRLERVLWP